MCGNLKSIHWTYWKFVMGLMFWERSALGLSLRIAAGVDHSHRFYIGPGRRQPARRTIRKRGVLFQCGQFGFVLDNVGQGDRPARRDQLWSGATPRVWSQRAPCAKNDVQIDLNRLRKGTDVAQIVAWNIPADSSVRASSIAARTCSVTSAAVALPSRGPKLSNSGYDVIRTAASGGLAWCPSGPSTGHCDAIALPSTLRCSLWPSVGEAAFE